jgi:hypothetical protein
MASISPTPGFVPGVGVYEVPLSEPPGCAMQKRRRCILPFITFVDVLFTTLWKVRFTKVFDASTKSCTRCCVWRARIAD